MPAEQPNGAAEATQRLAALCEQTGWDPSPAAVRRLVVEDGADVCARSNSARSRILHKLVEAGRVEAVKACLETPRAVDYTLNSNSFGSSVLHVACEGHLPATTNAALMRALVYRLETHPQDMVDWGQLNRDGRPVMGVAARYQRLHCLFPLVQHVPFFADMTERSRLDVVWRWDWEALEEEERAGCFNVSGVTWIEADGPTARLYDLSLRDEPDVGEVETCIAQGANIHFREPGPFSPTTLHHFFGKKGERVAASCVAACFRTRAQVDFTMREPHCGTVLHWICLKGRHRDDVAALLQLVLLRLASRAALCDACETSPPLLPDSIDWGLKHTNGKDFISRAANCRQLSVVWPVLKQHRVAYFLERGRPIPLHSRVYSGDWGALAQEDRRYFDPQLGFC